MMCQSQSAIDMRLNTEFIADGEAHGNYLPLGNSVENTA
jgi:hypothetical protein